MHRRFSSIQCSAPVGHWVQVVLHILQGVLIRTAAGKLKLLSMRQVQENLSHPQACYVCSMHGASGQAEVTYPCLRMYGSSTWPAHL